MGRDISSTDTRRDRTIRQAFYVDNLIGTMHSAVYNLLEIVRFPEQPFNICVIGKPDHLSTFPTRERHDFRESGKHIHGSAKRAHLGGHIEREFHLSQRLP
jgi:hypothetical protein